MKASLASAIFGLLVFRVMADFPCKTEQIHWTATPGKRYKCLECPDCPAGSQPSVQCGSSVAYGTPVHCISCQLGKTYSDKYGKEACKACTVCSEGKVVKKNCTLFSNSDCDDKCAHGFYSAPLIFGCFPCTQCCNDSKDEIAEECESYGKKCKVRSAPCTNPVPPTAFQTTTDSQTPSTVSQITHPEREITTGTFSVPPSWPVNNRKADEGRAIDSKESKTGESRALVILAIVGAALAILGLIVFIVRLFTNDTCRYPCYKNSNHAGVYGMVPFQLNRSVSASQAQLNPDDDMTLEQLESRDQAVFDRMCLKLDSGRWWFRRDYERLAAKYKRIPLEVRNALRDQLQIEGGSPSKLLMSHLQTKYPSLPLRYFVSTLKEIGRNDIVQLLMSYVGQNNSTSHP